MVFCVSGATRIRCFHSSQNLRPNVHTIHLKFCDISNFQYYLGQIGWMYAHWDAVKVCVQRRKCIHVAQLTQKTIHCLYSVDILQNGARVMRRRRIRKAHPYALILSKGLPSGVRWCVPNGIYPPLKGT